MKKFDMRL